MQYRQSPAQWYNVRAEYYKIWISYILDAYASLTAPDHKGSCIDKPASQSFLEATWNVHSAVVHLTELNPFKMFHLSQTLSGIMQIIELW